MKKQLGDVVHVSNFSTISKIIKSSTTGRGERHSWASHTECMLDENYMIGATGKGVRIVNLKEWYAKHPKSQIVVTRPTQFNPAIEETEKLLLRYDGRVYGYHKILAHYADHLIGDRYFFRRILFMEKYPICSWAIASTYYKLFDYKFGVELNAASPDDIADHCARGILYDYTWKVVDYSSRCALDNFLESVDPLHRI